MGGLLRCFSILVIIIAVGLGALRYFAINDLRARGSIPFILGADNQALEDIPDLKGKIILVTGANAGLGKSSAKHLVSNGATVIMACRSNSKCNQAKREIEEDLKHLEVLSEKAQKNIKERYKNGKLVVKELDLSSLQSVKDFSTAFLKEFKQLDSLMLNAGVMHPPYGLTKDGIETQMGVNHFGHFYLTKLLLPLLEKSQPATIVSVSSAGHHSAPDVGIYLNLDELNDEKNFDTAAYYGQSKLANVLFAQELAERMEKAQMGIYVNSVHPGVVMTELSRHWDQEKLQRVSFIRELPFHILFPPDWAALTQIFCAVNPKIVNEKINGKYFIPIAEEWSTSDHAKNTTLQTKLWEFTEKVLKSKGFS